jgi:hypothetical protein
MESAMKLSEFQELAMEVSTRLELRKPEYTSVYSFIEFNTPYYMAQTVIDETLVRGAVCSTPTSAVKSFEDAVNYFLANGETMGKIDIEI